jgi:hypothetical protein
MPTPSTQQRYMDVHEGKSPAVDGDLILRNMIWSPKFVTSVVDLTLDAKDTGTWYMNTAATEASIVYTLPAISTGPWIFFFVAVADVTLSVAAATADTLLAFNDAEADSIAFSTSSEKRGGIIMAYCDGTTVGVCPLGMGGHVQTVTVTS